MRIIYSPTEREGLELALDKEREGDQVVKSEEGRIVLLIQSTLAREFSGMVLDNKEMIQGIGFIITKVQ